MAKMVEYLNPHPHAIQLSSPDRKIIKIQARAKVVLSDWYMTYCPKYLRVVRILNEEKKIAPKEIPVKNKYQRKAQPPTINKPKFTIQNRVGSNKPRPNTEKPQGRVNSQIPTKIKQKLLDRKRPIVGRKLRESSRQLYAESYQNNAWSISSNIGIGILSYNRLNSLKRLIGSIRQYTDLSEVTVFVSDESSDQAIKTWLNQQKDIVVLTNQKRLGIAGNTNRLLRCLSRFKYKFLLNDDVEIIQAGWETFYRDAAEATKLHHFCYHQPGIYGAKRSKDLKSIANYQVEVVKDKPHGAVMFLTHTAFEKVGYFDEKFGIYGIEHVDWSERVSMSKIQMSGFLDILGSDKYFKIHKEKSAVVGRSTELTNSRQLYSKIKSPSRIRIEATDETLVPSVSIIIPLRVFDRQKATEVVINSMRSQLYPNIELILVEQDQKHKFDLSEVNPCKYYLSKNKYPTQPFTKAMAFNLGVLKASHDKIILQDADIICPSDYIAKIARLLDIHDGAHIGAKVLYLSKDSTRNIETNPKVDLQKSCERAVGYFEGGSLACTKRAYVTIGGFNEIFEGYGIEDCDFFERLKHGTNFYNTRTVDFIHLWHGRTDGWENHHNRNKKLYKQLRKKYQPAAYVASLVTKLNKAYPGIGR